MNAIQSDSKPSNQHERELIHKEMNVFPLRPERIPPASAPPDEANDTRHSRALAVFKGALIGSTVVFVTITLALQAVARFS
jgi:hypothetical protein